MQVRELSRRRVVLDLGRGALAVLVLGSAGCSAARRSAAPPSASRVAAPAGSPAGSTSASPAVPPGPDATGPLRWSRVDLGFVSAYVLVRGGQATVVDTGVAGSADAIGAVLDRAGPGWAGVRHVVLTHHHPDHAGSMAEVLTRAAAATGHVGAADLDQVDAPRPLRPLADGDEVFGLRVVATPGHTAGHVSVFDPGSGVLLAGDALRNTAGLAGSDPAFTADPAAAARSVRVLARLPVRTVLFGHGDPLTSGAAPALAALAAG